MVQKWHTLFRVEGKWPLLINDKKKKYFLVANCYIAEAINKYGKDNINTLGRHIIHMYIHETLIPKMSEVMDNGKTKSKLLKNSSLTTLCQDTVGEWIIKIGFKYNYSVNNPHHQWRL